MEHRLCSPSTTYTDMPVVRKAYACKGVQLNKNGSLKNNNSNESNQLQVILEPKDTTIYSKQRTLDTASSKNKVQPTVSHSNVQVPKVTTPNQKEKALVMYKGPGCNFNSVFHQKGDSYNELDLVKPSTSKDQTNIVPHERRKMICFRNQKDVDAIVLRDSDSESDSDSHSSMEFFKNERPWRELRFPYTGAEDEEILKFVLKGNNILRTSSLLLWKELESVKRNPKRTFQSLKNRFLRNIKPNLLCKFRYMLSTEDIKMVKKRYPELRKSNAYLIPDSKTYPRIRMNEKITDAGPSEKNDTNAGSSKNCDAKSAPNGNQSDRINPLAFAPKEPCRVRTLTDAEVCDDRLRLKSGCEETLARGDNKQTEENRISMYPESSYADAERLVHIFAREKLENVPVQTFKFYEKIGPFSKKAALDLKLLLYRSEGDGFRPADLPINVTVSVTVGKEEADELEQQVHKRSPSKTDLAEIKPSQKKKRPKVKKKSTSRKCYVLKVKRENKKLKSALPYYMKLVDGLLKKVEEHKKIEEGKSNIESNSLSIKNQSNVAVPSDNCTQESFSQSTNCSTEDESCYTQTFKKISEKYKVEITQTPESPEKEGKRDDSINSESKSPRNREERLLKMGKKGSLLGNMMEIVASTSPADVL